MSKKKSKRRNKILGITKTDIAMGQRLQKARPTLFEQVKNIVDAPTIGLGLESDIKTIRIRREDVHLDQNTKTTNDEKRHHALHTAGWSLKNDIHK